MMRSDETPPAEHVSQTQASEQPAALVAPSKKKGILLPVLLMIAPGLLIVASIMLYAVANFIMGAQPAAPTDSSLFGEEAPNPARAIINTLLFLMGTISALSVPPCFIIGLILLIQRLQK